MFINGILIVSSNVFVIWRLENIYEYVNGVTNYLRNRFLVKCTLGYNDKGWEN